MIKIGIVGGTGYTGVELLRLLAGHPQAQIVAITSRKEAGMPVAEMYPSLRGRVDLALKDLQEAVAIGPTAYRYFHLAQARLTAKDRKGALQARERYQSLKLDEKTLHPLERPVYRKVQIALSAR